MNRSGGVMVSIVTSSAVDCELNPGRVKVESWSGQSKDYKIGSSLLLC